MALWMDLLFGNWFGLSAVLVILFMLGMSAFFLVLFISKSKKPDN